MGKGKRPTGKGDYGQRRLPWPKEMMAKEETIGKREYRQRRLGSKGSMVVEGDYGQGRRWAKKTMHEENLGQRRLWAKKTMDKGDRDRGRS